MPLDTYGHTPPDLAFERADVYGIGFDEQRAARKKLRLGLIGAGAVAQCKHLPALRRLQTLWEPVELVAFADPNQLQAGKVSAVFGGRWYPDYRALLAEEEVDGVLVCSPDACHAEHTLACLEAGLPVLVEKPIARSLADALRMCRLAEERRLLLMTVANKRYAPPYFRARRLILEGPVKDPALFTGKFNLGYDYVDLFEAGTIHLFDLTRYLMGDVLRVRCIATNRYRRSRRNYPIDNAVITLEFASGAIGALTTSATALSFKPWERVEVYGDRAWLEVDDQYRLSLYATETGPTQSWTPVFPNTLIFDEEFGGFTGMLENFLQAIRGLEPPLATGWDGYRAFELLTAAQCSLARGGETIPLPLDPGPADREAQAWLRANGWTGETRP